MVTMKGFTSSLPLLLLLTFPHGSAGEAEPVDYTPDDASMILLPTTIGTMGIPTNFTKNAGQFPSALVYCGKSSTDATGRDQSYKKASSFESYLDCHPHPMRVIVRSDGASVPTIGVADGFDVGSCQGHQSCDATATMLFNHKGQAGSTSLKPLNPQGSGDMCQPSKAILFSNEMGCASNDVPKSTDDHQGKYVIVPRWKTRDDGFFEVLRPFMYNGMGQKKEKTFDRTNSFVNFKTSTDMKPTHQWASCQGTCDRGNIVKMNMKKGAWKTTIYLRYNARGFKVCIDAHGHDEENGNLKCRPKFELFVLPQNGVVVWPKTGRASILQMKGPDAQPDGHFAIELGFGYGQTADGKLAGEFYVGNMYREVVVSDSDGWNVNEASRVSFFFEDDEALSPTGGIQSDNIESGKTYIDKNKVAGVEDVPSSAKTGASVADGKENLALTKEPPQEPMIASTTPASRRLSSNAQAGVLLQSSDYSNAAIYMPGKWWAWGLYIGFIIGSIVGAAIIGAIFYVLRRTVYGFWYRGMYKRYGCDASGTTGGITGVGFGNTTTGAITVGGTTGGGTTAGTTAGTTGSTTRTGGTTGGTTGSMTSTGGASTIAM